MADYRLTNSPGVIRTSDGAVIPNAPGNVDWDEYQKWLSVPNTPDPYVVVQTVPAQISSRQFWMQMAMANFIDESEAVKALGGDIPNVIKQFVNTLPVLQRFPARMFFEASTFDRHKRTGEDLKACFSIDDAAIDQFFQNAALL